MLEPVSLKLDPVKNKNAKKWYQHIPPNLRILLGFLAIAWTLELIDFIPFVSEYSLDRFGVRPRSTIGLIGLLLMPFLHGDLPHLISNTLPFLLLGFIVLKAEKKQFIIASLAIILLGGFGTWLFGSSNSNHIGASGLVYGYFGYIMVRAYMERKIIWMITGVVVAIVYWQFILGALPMQDRTISWLGHLCGLVAGGWFGRKRTEQGMVAENDVERIIKDIRESKVNDNEETETESVEEDQNHISKIQKEIKESKEIITGIKDSQRISNRANKSDEDTEANEDLDEVSAFADKNHAEEGKTKSNDEIPF